MWYGDKVHLLFTDTDSLMIEVETEDFYKDMFDHKEWFDLSFFPVGHPYPYTANDKVHFTTFYLLLTLNF